MRNVRKSIAYICIAITVGVGLALWLLLYPHHDPEELAFPLVSADSDVGRLLLENADSKSDYLPLTRNYQAQILASYCGVASSVSVLKALGQDVTQNSFFTREAANIRSRLSVIFGGMSLTELGALLTAHGVSADIYYAGNSSVEKFRNRVERNLSEPDDYLIVNYQREVLGQLEIGHISPLAAYNRDSDSVLIMDTTRNQYPPTWVPINLLFDAMNTVDAATGNTRGFVEVSL